ncbi:osmotically inducible protein OsmC [Clavibacter michiganensis]|uniref:Osmotically inducible protein OsmC n=2 Tax=Clavibacter michiganensis TaxID=28447 RepID=A0A2S5VUZ0_9MICO|nr:osmotically inducible protein OsmC [Clavibacter michiganensis]PPF68539.1 osmotically inducible protein OsmC [Clavibacter michiganensis]
MKEHTMPQHPKGSVLEFDLRGTGSGVLQEVSIAGSAHTVRAEGHPAFGGTDSAPSPLDLVLSAYVSCNQVTATIVALGQGITLGAFEGRVQAELDNSVLVFGAEGDGTFQRLTLTVDLETELDDAAFEAFVAEVARRCPLTQLFERSGVEIANVWTNRALARA